jgi:hypothetical protein
MRGTVKAYSVDVNAGVIECDSGETYNFSQKEWNGATTPTPEQRVTFQASPRTATKVFSEA